MKLVPLRTDYIESTKKLCDKSVGEGFYSEDDLCRLMALPGTFFNLLLEDDGTLIGYNYNHLATEKEVMNELKTPVQELRQVSNGSSDTVYGICKSMGIELDKRSSGLGLNLLRYGVTQLMENGAMSLWGSAWKQGSKIPMRSIFEQLEFSYLHDVKNMWYDIKTLICPVCKQPCCVCDAALFYKNKNKL